MGSKNYIQTKIQQIFPIIHRIQASANFQNFPRIRQQPLEDISPLAVCLTSLLPGPTTEITVVLLPDDLDSNPVQIRDPEGEPHLSTGSAAEDPTDGVLGGELIWEGLLRLLVTDEDEDLLVGTNEGDLCVVFQRPH